MAQHPHGPVALLTDFGTRDWYVASLKGVILSRSPGTHLVDITHEIPPQDIVAGAFTLAAAAAWFPVGTVFLAIVDPGVGSTRALVAVRASGRYFVGPDNGLLSLSVSASPHRRIVRLANRRYWLKTVSQTFQGRDILAPVAAHLAAGGSLSSLGVTTRQMASLTLPAAHRRGRAVHGAIVHIDAFGNLITNLSECLLRDRRRTGIMRVRYKHREARVVSSYAMGRPNELIAVVGSLGFMELAIREGSAALTHDAKRGDVVELLG